MNRVILIFLGSLILLGLNACKDDGNAVPDKPLVDTEWDLQSFEIVGGVKSDIGSEGMILIFKSDSTFYGWSYPIEGLGAGNKYGGVYEVALDGSLSIRQTYSTQVGLRAGSKYVEYFQALQNASAYEIQGNTLKILYDRRKRALNFKGE